MTCRDVASASVYMRSKTVLMEQKPRKLRLGNHRRCGVSAAVFKYEHNHVFADVAKVFRICAMCSVSHTRVTRESRVLDFYGRDLTRVFSERTASYKSFPLGPSTKRTSTDSSSGRKLRYVDRCGFGDDHR